MRFSRSEVKKLLTAYFVTAMAFLIIFSVVLPLMWGHHPASVGPSAWFMVNFLYSVSLYFILVFAFSFISHHLLKNEIAEISAFIVTYGLSFITLFMIWFFFIPTALGQSPPPFSRFDSSQLPFSLLLQAFISVIPAGLAVFLYEIDKLAKTSQKKGTS